MAESMGQANRKNNQLPLPCLPLFVHLGSSAFSCPFASTHPSSLASRLARKDDSSQPVFPPEQRSDIFNENFLIVEQPFWGNWRDFYGPDPRPPTRFAAVPISSSVVLIHWERWARRCFLLLFYFFFFSLSYFPWVIRERTESLYFNNCQICVER